jgi:hypothetical protein
MCAEVYGAYVFWATQLKAKIKRESIGGLDAMRDAAIEVGKNTRRAIDRNRGDMPDGLSLIERKPD